MKWWWRLGISREPDFVIGAKDEPYLRRWWVIPRNPIFNIYLHQFLHSDDDRALHDHMYFNLSILLEGSYVEHSILAGGVQKSVLRKAGELKFRSPWAAHRIEISEPCWTLFITGPRMRNWGFHCPKGWRRWQDFVSERDSGAIGRGCN